MKLWHIFFEVENKFLNLFMRCDSQFASLTINAPCSLEKINFRNSAFSVNQKTKIPQPFSQAVFLPQKPPFSLYT